MEVPNQVGSKSSNAAAVVAVSFERIHRSNLIGMGVLPLEFVAGESAETLGLSGHEVVSISGLASGCAGEFQKGALYRATAKAEDGSEKIFSVRSRVDTPQEALYYRNGGILQYVLRSLA